MRRTLSLIVLILCGACGRTLSHSYLFVWTGDAAQEASDFLAVIDADPGSPRFASVIASVPTGATGTQPHHTEQEMPPNGPLLANGFHAGRTWLFDLTQPSNPRILASFGDIAGYSHPHTFGRLPNGHVLATFQYLAGAGAMLHPAGHGSEQVTEHSIGGLVEMDERGHPFRSGSANDSQIEDKRIYPYSVVALPEFDRAISTTTDMDHADTTQTSQWVQIWRLSDLKLLRSIAVQPGPRGV